MPGIGIEKTQLQGKLRDIPTLAAEFTAAHPELDVSQQRLVLATIRLLGEGAPVAPQAISERTGLPHDEVVAYLDEAPTLQRDEHGRVLAFFGLTLEPTSHALEVEGRTLYAWCALDTLFLPERLGQPARVRSACPQTGATIALTVDTKGVRDVVPHDAVMSLHGVGGLDLADAVGTFCCFVHFFASEQAARAWMERSEGTYIASIAEGFEYGRLFNHSWLGAALEEGGA
ncbi:MAG: organomercurial lyase [Gaiellaceae bacterium]